MVIREVLHHHLVCAVMCVHSLVIAQTVFNLLSFLYSKCSTFQAACVCGQSYASISHNPTKCA